jgi:hypothetical protein
VRRLRLTLAAALLPTVVASCSSGSAPSAAGNAPAITTTLGSACAATPTTPGPLTWPAAVPQDFPKPPAATLDAVKQLQPKSGHKHPGVVVSLTVPASLQDEIRYVNRILPAAGFALGRGDAEQAEADIPFTRADVTGQLRLRRATTCRTTWILTVLPR